MASTFLLAATASLAIATGSFAQTQSVCAFPSVFSDGGACYEDYKRQVACANWIPPLGCEETGTCDCPALSATGAARRMLANPPIPYDSVLTLMYDTQSDFPTTDATVTGCGANRDVLPGVPANVKQVYDYGACVAQNGAASLACGIFDGEDEYVYALPVPNTSPGTPIDVQVVFDMTADMVVQVYWSLTDAAGTTFGCVDDIDDNAGATYGNIFGTGYTWWDAGFKAQVTYADASQQGTLYMRIRGFFWETVPSTGKFIVQTSVPFPGPPSPDTDGDGVPDAIDQCPDTFAYDEIALSGRKNAVFQSGSNAGCSVSQVCCQASQSDNVSDFKECVKDAMRQLRDEGSDTGKQVISRAHMCEIEDVLESATVPLCQSYPVNLVRNWSFEEASVVTSGYVWTTLINYWYTSAPNLPVSCSTCDGTMTSYNALEVWYTGFNGAVAPDGKQLVELNSDGHYTPWDVMQDVVLPYSGKYKLTFFYRARVSPDSERMDVLFGPEVANLAVTQPGTGSDFPTISAATSTFLATQGNVSLNSNIIATIGGGYTPSSTDFTQYCLVLENITPGLYTLRFMGDPTTSTLGNLLDAISLTYNQSC